MDYMNYLTVIIPYTEEKNYILRDNHWIGSLSIDRYQISKLLPQWQGNVMQMEGV